MWGSQPVALSRSSIVAPSGRLRSASTIAFHSVMSIAALALVLHAILGKRREAAQCAPLRVAHCALTILTAEIGASGACRMPPNTK